MLRFHIILICSISISKVPELRNTSVFYDWYFKHNMHLETYDLSDIGAEFSPTMSRPYSVGLILNEWFLQKWCFAWTPWVQLEKSYNFDLGI